MTRGLTMYVTLQLANENRVNHILRYVCVSLFGSQRGAMFWRGLLQPRPRRWNAYIHTYIRTDGFASTRAGLWRGTVVTYPT